MTITILLIVLFGLSKHFRDDIAYNHRHFRKWDWWCENRWERQHKSDLIEWLTKNPLSFLRDGWHLNESINVIGASLFFCMAIDISLWWSILVYGLIGGIHSLLDGSLFRK